MKLLLTSAGIKNPSIEAALVELLGKPIAGCDALAIPTASYGHNSFAGARPLTLTATTGRLRHHGRWPRDHQMHPDDDR